MTATGLINFIEVDVQGEGFHNRPPPNPTLGGVYPEMALPGPAIHSMIRIPFWCHTALGARAEAIDR